MAYLANLPLRCLIKKTIKGVLISLPNCPDVGFWYPRKYCGYSETDSEKFSMYYKPDHPLQLFKFKQFFFKDAEKKEVKSVDVLDAFTEKETVPIASDEIKPYDPADYYKEET